MEKLFYEAKPYLCIYLGATAAQTMWMQNFGLPFAIMLVGCGILFITARFEFRSHGAVERKWDGHTMRTQKVGSPGTELEFAL